MTQVLKQQERIGTVEANKLLASLDTLKQQLEGYGLTCVKSEFANGAKITVSIEGNDISEYCVTLDRYTASLYLTVFDEGEVA